MLSQLHCEFFPLIRVSLAAIGTIALGSGRPKLDFHLLPFWLTELLLNLYASALQSSWAVFTEFIPICQCCTGKMQTEYCHLDVAFKCWIKGTNHFPGYAGSILLNAAQYVVRLIVERAHCWTCPHWLPRSFTTKLLSSGLPGSTVRCGYSAFGIHEAFSANSWSLLRSLQKAILPCSVLISLSSLVSSALAKGTFHLIHSQDVKCSTDIKQHHPNISSWRMPLLLSNSCSLH